MLGDNIILVMVLGIIALFVCIAWIFLPFAMFGTKDILRDILKEQRRMNQLLDDRLPALRLPTRRDSDV